MQRSRYLTLKLDTIAPHLATIYLYVDVWIRIFNLEYHDIINKIMDEQRIIEFPHCLYRAFKEQIYARDFVENGKFRLLPLKDYREIEDHNRKDENEGSGKLTIYKDRPVLTMDINTQEIISNKNEYGPVYFTTDSINPRYILCFSGPQVDLKYLAEKYGPYIVRLLEPEILFTDIAFYLHQGQTIPDATWVRFIKVRYDKGLTAPTEPAPASEERLELSFSQKDPIFSQDCEYRIVVTLPIKTANDPESIFIDLGKRLEYAQLL